MLQCGCLNLLSKLVSSDACRYIGVSGAHSCGQCSPVSLLCMVGIMFTVKYLSARSHWPRVVPLLQLLIWLFSQTSIGLKVSCDWCSTLSAQTIQLVNTRVLVDSLCWPCGEMLLYTDQRYTWYLILIFCLTASQTSGHLYLGKKFSTVNWWWYCTIYDSESCLMTVFYQLHLSVVL